MRRIFRPWPRRARIIRNLAVTALLLLAVWVSLGAPLTQKQELRRFERGCVVPHGDIVLRCPSGNVWGSTVYLSVSGAAAVSYEKWDPLEPRLGWLYPLEGGGPQLLLLRTLPFYFKDGDIGFTYACVLVRPPEGADRAELTFDSPQGAITLRSETESAKSSGSFLFIIPPRYTEDSSYESWRDPENRACTVRFWDAAGNEIR